MQRTRWTWSATTRHEAVKIPQHVRNQRISQQVCNLHGGAATSSRSIATRFQVPHQLVQHLCDIRIA